MRWGDAEWDRWLREHPWEAAERVCSRGDWAVFLYQIRQHAPKGKKGVEAVLEQLVNERPLTAQETEDLRAALDVSRDEMDEKPAEAMKSAGGNFAGAENLDAMIAAARQRLGKDPTLGDVWAPVFDPTLASNCSTASPQSCELFDGAGTPLTGLQFAVGAQAVAESR